jgi:hypothetical protein
MASRGGGGRQTDEVFLVLFVHKKNALPSWI